MATKYSKMVTVGQQFGEWTVIGEPETDEKGRAKVAVCCSCGNESSVRVPRLLNGKSTQCRDCAQGRTYTFTGLANRFTINSNRTQTYDSSFVSKSLSNQSYTCAITGTSLDAKNMTLVSYNSQDVMVDKTLEVMLKSSGMSPDQFVELCETVVDIKNGNKTPEPSSVEEFFNRRDKDE